MAETGGMAIRLKRHLVLVGMMGAGKTAVGRALASRLGVPFLDSDAEIERAAAMTIGEIFARDGERFFRARETEVLSRLLDGSPGVLSTGGGVFLSETNRAIIARKGVSIWLKAEPDLLWTRVRHKATRPLLQTADPRGTLERICAERRPAYEQAELAVDCAPEVPIEAMADRVIAALRAHPGILEDKR
ncbi:MAG: shikimate kinase [Paracoccaceae bacterium]